MTKEEALAILKYNSKVIHQTIDGETDPNEVEALDMAIKALEIVEEFEKAQIITGGRLNGRTYAYKCGLEDGKRKALEQQPTSDDCVSRQAVLDCLTATGLKKFDFILDAREKVNNLSPVIPTRKVGKWIEEPNCWLRCSCCNSHYPHTSIYAIKGSNYCPNCGAEMRGTEKW